jgi:4-amino-4-deoxy-L-arabinose transferase-like glycosyltransferase
MLLIWERMFGIGEFSGRALSSIFGIIGIIAIYFLGKELFSKEVGIFAAAILSVNSFHLYYSQEVRMYSLLFLLTVLSLLFFVKFVKRPSVKNSLWYGLFTVLLIYTHYFGLFIFASQIIFFIFVSIEHLKESKFVKKFILAISAIILSYIPWFPTLLRMGRLKDFWIPKPSSNFFVNYYKNFFGNEPFLVILFSVLFLIYLLEDREKEENIFKNHKLLLITSIFIPLFMPYFWSLEHSSALTDRNATVERNCKVCH